MTIDNTHILFYSPVCKDGETQKLGTAFLIGRIRVTLNKPALVTYMSGEVVDRKYTVEENKTFLHYLARGKNAGYMLPEWTKNILLGIGYIEFDSHGLRTSSFSSATFSYTFCTTTFGDDTTSISDWQTAYTERSIWRYVHQKLATLLKKYLGWKRNWSIAYHHKRT